MAADLPASRAKAELREWARAFRRSLTPEEVAGRSRRILGLLALQPEFVSARGILICTAFDNEPDLGSLLVSPPEGKQLYLPRTHYMPRWLSVHPYPALLERSRYGILEPVADAPAVPQDVLSRALDLIVIPGLAFEERSLRRLGAGGGFFDRFLAEVRVPAIGIGYDETILPDMPVDPHDLPMSAVITDRRVIRPGGHADAL
jgi:5-formyltetrahydrofolate cyclo-ligase